MGSLGVAYMETAQARQEGDFVPTEQPGASAKGHSVGRLRKQPRVEPGRQAPPPLAPARAVRAPGRQLFPEPGFIDVHKESAHTCLLFSFCLAVLPPASPCSQGLVSGGPEVHGRHRTNRGASGLRGCPSGGRRTWPGTAKPEEVKATLTSASHEGSIASRLGTGSRVGAGSRARGPPT